MTVRIERATRKAVATIPNGAAVSNAVDMGGSVIAAIGWPAAWTAADLRFDASFDGGTTWLPVYDDAGVRVQIASASLPVSEARAYANKAILEQIAGMPMIRLVSSVNQGADRAIVVYLKG